MLTQSTAPAAATFAGTTDALGPSAAATASGGGGAALPWYNARSAAPSTVSARTGSEAPFRGAKRARLAAFCSDEQLARAVFERPENEWCVAGLVACVAHNPFHGMSDHTPRRALVGWSVRLRTSSPRCGACASFRRMRPGLRRTGVPNSAGADKPASRLRSSRRVQSRCALRSNQMAARKSACRCVPARHAAPVLVRRLTQWALGRAACSPSSPILLRWPARCATSADRTRGRRETCIAADALVRTSC